MNNDGAWIVKNSYGKNWGKNGYFYLSYEDKSITNLVSNAERHTQNGTITISLTGEPGWQTICVSDTGTGMSEEMRKNALKGYVSADKDYCGTA